MRVSTDVEINGQPLPMAFYFPVVDGRAAELVLHWGRVVVPIQITAP
jgi:hypothetical protein